ncbi:MAG: hypothetical protein ACRDY7_15950 [Acidimicrobiia bacterium]
MKGLTGQGQHPWRRPDVGIFAAGEAVGLAVVLIAWILASGEVLADHQMPAVYLGIAGTALAGAAGAGFLRRGRLALTARRAVVSDHLRARGRAVFPPVEVDVRSATAPGTGAVLVSSDLMTRYHRAGCPLVVGKPTINGSGEAHTAAGRRPCGVCQP